ncbi:MAG: transglutaminase-like domain-containing protein [Candidatus Nanoarchaeia archaeon]
MKRLLGLLLIIILSTPVLAQLETSDLYKHEYLILDTQIESDMQLQPEDSDWVADYVLVKLFFSPVEDKRLEVLSLRTSPNADLEDGVIEYRWDNPEDYQLGYKLDARVKTKTLYNMIPNKVSFPVGFIPKEVQRYTQITESVDYDDVLIRKLANEIAEGEDDLYVVANKAALWVRDNIDYNLSTVTSKASKPASWVIRNRKGVCDEITNLFLAIMRSLDAPAKFVSGVAYTNSPLFAEKWGPHGWAEVYFPKYGWIPFDPTYGQFGWLDPSHIKLKESYDAVEPSTKFEWRGRNIDLYVNPLDFNVDVVTKGPEVDYKINIENKVMKASTGFGSYNVVETSVENLNNYYLTTDINLARTQGLNVLGPRQQSVILKPYESAKLYWTVKVEPTVNGNFIYTFPVMAYDIRNVSSTVEFAASRGEPVFTKSDAERFIRMSEPEKTKSYKDGIGLDCEVAAAIFLNDPEPVHCSVTNSGNTVLNNLKVCKKKQCTTVKLNIGESQDVQFSIKEEVPGKYVEGISAVAAKEMADTEVSYTVLDKPSVRIRNVTLPHSVKFEDKFELTFTAKKDSFASVPAGKTQVLLNGISIQEWPFPNLDQPHEYTFSMRGSDLSTGDNTVTIVVMYPTRNGNVERKVKLEIILTDLTISQTMQVWLNGMARWVGSWF